MHLQTLKEVDEEYEDRSSFWGGASKFGEESLNDTQSNGKKQSFQGNLKDQQNLIRTIRSGSSDASIQPATDLNKQIEASALRE